MSRQTKNILFIMFDQLRFDYLSCYGHPHLHTPHMDRLAEQGVRFTNVYCQSPACGPSRMSFYTGRYVDSHGASSNGFPLRVGEYTLGDHLRKLGMDAYLLGKTHMTPDLEGMARLGLSPDSMIGARVAECGFDLIARDDGLWPEGPDGCYDQRVSPYNTYLKDSGYESDNPWLEHANAGVGDNGEMASGWFMKHADKPANIREEDSETAFLTTRCMEFIDRQNQPDSKPWLCHLSYIKPHWPYIVPAPYHAMYGQEHRLPVNRAESERENPHPLYQLFMDNMIGKAFRRDEVLEKVVPAYTGLIKQCDDQLGRLFKHLEKTGRMQDTLIVITADHGDYMGDHWLGEKDLFHAPSVKVPLIVYDPSTEADATRGQVCDELVETIDITATFVEAAGGVLKDHRDHLLEGRSLLPYLHGQPMSWREYAISELDYSISFANARLKVPPRDARLFMVADKHWKYVNAALGGFRPLLFDLKNDPGELQDLGASTEPEHMEAMMLMEQRLAEWSRRLSQRSTVSEQQIRDMPGKSQRCGIILGAFDEREVAAELTTKFFGKVKQRFVGVDS